MKVLEQVVEGKSGNHILPFLWMKGEDNERIRQELDRIEECGIREVCLESRPHPDFCGSQWWENLDFILEEAKKRNMRIWILDDDKFPTGHANGGFEKKHPELSKTYLAERHMDIMGPCRDNAVLVENFLGNDGKLIAILALPKPDGNSLSVKREGVVNLTSNYRDGFVYFDLPEGAYRLFVIFTTQNGGGRENYMNLIDSASVRILIEEVYEKHYHRYRKYFGKELAGFFSDEPELGNVPGYPFDCSLGQKDIRLPWSKELENILRSKWAQDFLYNLPFLWYDGEDEVKTIRYTYMDCMTNLVKTCFSGQIGCWCEEHNVEYIGHILEDANSHTKLGCGTGHYFREMEGQHMSGIDVVHHQIVPGFTERVHQWIAGDTDGEFFHFGLAKMGSSAAHIDPKKRNRALCEIFGNYGWAEGLPLMRWLTDHMLVRGINHFTPHAFSMKEMDKDCPPHFYAGGKNPQFGGFTQLMKYMNRAAGLLSSGTHIAQAAVLYHGDMEWASGETQLFQKPVRKLLERQLDCDIIPSDILIEGKAKVEDRKLKINDKAYFCLVVPGCSVIPRQAAIFIQQAAAEGIQVFFTDEIPVCSEKGEKLSQEFYSAVSLVSLEELAVCVEEISDIPVVVHEHNDGLRLLTVEQDDGFVSMLFNENVREELRVKVSFRKGQAETVSVYDAWNNKAERYNLENGVLSLKLLPGNSVFLCSETEQNTGDKIIEENHTMPVSEAQELLPIRWKVERKGHGTDEDFKMYTTVEQKDILPNMNGLEYEPGFVGTYRYKGEFEIFPDERKRYFLLFREVSDTMYLRVNGYELGYAGTSPVRIEVTEVLKNGNNELCLDITTTLVWSRKDGASTHLQIPASGLTRQPVLEIYT